MPHALADCPGCSSHIKEIHQGLSVEDLALQKPLVNRFKTRQNCGLAGKQSLKVGSNAVRVVAGQCDPHEEAHHAATWVGASGRSDGCTQITEQLLRLSGLFSIHQFIQGLRHALRVVARVVDSRHTASREGVPEASV